MVLDFIKEDWVNIKVSKQTKALIDTLKEYTMFTEEEFLIRYLIGFWLMQGKT